MELKKYFLKYFGRILGSYTIVNWLLWLLIYVVGLLAGEVTLLDIVLYLGLLVFFLLLIWPQGFDYREGHWRIRLLLAVVGAIAIFIFVISGPGLSSIFARGVVNLYLIFQILGLTALPLLYRAFDRSMNPPLEDLSLIPLLPLSSFRIQWLVATSLGLGIGLGVAILVLPTDIILFFSIGGIFLGFSQWLVLRSILKKSGLWILATFCAWVWIDILFWSEPTMEVALVSLVLFQPLGGFLIGSAQWIILRKHYSDSRKWIFYNTGAWCIGALVSFTALVIMLRLLEIGTWFPIVLGIIIGTFHGIPYGLITGLTMERIMKTPILGQENTNKEKAST